MLVDESTTGGPDAQTTTQARATADSRLTPADEPEPIPGDPQPAPDQQIQDPPVSPEHDRASQEKRRDEIVFDEDEVGKQH